MQQRVVIAIEVAGFGVHPQVSVSLYSEKPSVPPYARSLSSPAWEMESPAGSFSLGKHNRRVTSSPRTRTVTMDMVLAARRVFFPQVSRVVRRIIKPPVNGWERLRAGTSLAEGVNGKCGSRDEEIVYLISYNATPIRLLQIIINSSTYTGAITGAC